MKYTLMRKDNCLASVEIGNTGLIKVHEVEENEKELLPFCQTKDITNGLRKWWNDRAIPLIQSGIRNNFNPNGVVLPSEYLQKNLGLGLTDYYWIKPIDSNLTWSQVSLFRNDFNTKKNFEKEESEEGKFSPNASLLGNLEKYWDIDKSGKRVLIKGNSDKLSREAINEVIVSEINRLQGYDNYVTYNLLDVDNRIYKLACSCEDFSDEDNEFISAISVIESEKKRNEINYLEHFKNICEEHGMDRGQLQYDLDYMLFMDFIISNTDRHWNNFGIIRDAKTLRFKRLAPIFDSGNSFFVKEVVPRSLKEITGIEINSIKKTEKQQLGLIEDKTIIDMSKLPSGSLLSEQYRRDEIMNEQGKELINAIAEAYEKKIKIAQNVQQGDLK